MIVPNDRPSRLLVGEGLNKKLVQIDAKVFESLTQQYFHGEHVGEVEAKLMELGIDPFPHFPIQAFLRCLQSYQIAEDVQTDRKADDDVKSVAKYDVKLDGGRADLLRRAGESLAMLSSEQLSEIATGEWLQRRVGPLFVRGYFQSTATVSTSPWCDDDDTSNSPGPLLWVAWWGGRRILCGPFSEAAEQDHAWLQRYFSNMIRSLNGATTDENQIILLPQMRQVHIPPLPKK